MYIAWPSLNFFLHFFFFLFETKQYKMSHKRQKIFQQSSIWWWMFYSITGTYLLSSSSNWPFRVVRWEATRNTVPWRSRSQVWDRLKHSSSLVGCSNLSQIASFIPRLCHLWVFDMLVSIMCLIGASPSILVESAFYRLLCFPNIGFLATIFTTSKSVDKI